MSGHVCFGCKRQIGDGEPHIHVGMDEFAAHSGLQGGDFGLDDLLTFPFCEDCTESGGPWQLEQHSVEQGDAK